MSDDKVIEFPGRDSTNVGTMPRCRTVDPVDVAKGVTENAGSLDQLLVIGVTHDGKLYAATSHADHADNLLLMERLRRKLLMSFGEDEFS